MNKTALKVSSRIAMLDVGMYIFRYALSDTQLSAKSCLSLHHSPIGKGSVDFFPGEGITRNTLTAPGDCVVVRVKGTQASVLITEYIPEGETGTIQLRIDRIETSLPKPSINKPADTPKAPARCQLKLLGHIEARGDVVAEGEWLGEPNTSLRMEGFSIGWQEQPAGLDLAYLCRTGKSSEPQVGLAGQFVGTRRQAKPITTVAFTLSGPKATNYQLSGQVVFAGCPPLSITPGKELSGPNGLEQLVAIQIVIMPKAAQVSPPASPWNDLATTQIFHSR
nr:hypothetical protein [Pseudomonas luteola]